MQQKCESFHSVQNAQRSEQEHKESIQTAKLNLLATFMAYDTTDGLALLISANST